MDGDVVIGNVEMYRFLRFGQTTIFSTFRARLPELNETLHKIGAGAVLFFQRGS